MKKKELYVGIIIILVVIFLLVVLLAYKEPLKSPTFEDNLPLEDEGSDDKMIEDDEILEEGIDESIDENILVDYDEVVSEVKLLTEDSKNLVGTFYKSEDSRGSIILLHMLDHDKSSWIDFAKLLQKNKYSVLAVDMRGHGESDGDWNDFGSDEFNDMVFDVKAAKLYLVKEGVDVTKLSIIGASIGSNIALKYSVADNDVKTIVLLSPGIDYRGVMSGQDMLDYENRPLLIVASSEDEYSAKSSEKLLKISKSTTKELKMYSGVGHGTDMFDAEPGLMQLIVDWVDKNDG